MARRFDLRGLRVKRARFHLARAIAMLSSGIAAGCIPKDASSPSGTAPASAGATPAVAEAPAPPPPPPAAPVPPIGPTGNRYTDHFLELWTEIHDLKNGYFSPEGVPYHAVETLLVEAPDHGHETTSEAYSYWVWLEAVYGKATGDWSFLDRAWKNLEYYVIPRREEQPTNAGYNPGKPATYAEEGDHPSDYPKPLVGSVAVGRDPIAEELQRTYGTADVYGMHWLVDVDNWYGFGRRGDGRSRVALINTFQRGPEESVFETVTQPTWDAFTFGGAHGFLDLFQSSDGYARQWKYSNAPDADARAVQAVYWAKRWADEKQQGQAIDAIVKKTSKLGDYCRYALFDKYFKKIGCTDPRCEPAREYDSAHYLISWYYAWGGAAPGAGNWAWRIASSHNHSGYQNPMAAWALSRELSPASPNGARDWARSLDRQLEFYRWLQSAEGAIAGGATNSFRGRYERPPAGTKTFYGMAYESAPVFRDPPSNDWFGFQVWSMERVAEYYFVTGDPRAKAILDRWVAWAKKNTRVTEKNFEVPSTLNWTGQPSSDWDATRRNADNVNLHVRVVSHAADVGTAAGLAQTLAFYAKRANDEEARALAASLLDRIWAFRDDRGVSNPETRGDYRRFLERVHVPAGWEGKMPNGDAIESGKTFLDIRSKFKKDRDWPRVKAYLDGGPPPTFRYHRFWAQSHVAIAYATYGWLFPGNGP